MNEEECQQKEEVVEKSPGSSRQSMRDFRNTTTQPE